MAGRPSYFDIGLVPLMPVTFLVSRRSGLTLIRAAHPALAAGPA